MTCDDCWKSFFCFVACETVNKELCRLEDDMKKRCTQESFSSGPRKVDGNKVITRCLDCSCSGTCEHQARSHWPVTTIAMGCPLKSRKHEW